MKIRSGLPFAVALVLALGACGTANEDGVPTRSAPAASKVPTSTPSDPTPSPAIRDIMSFEPLAPIDAGTYFIDPDLDATTPLRVMYEVPAGWWQWIGAAKFAGEGHVGVSITTVANLVRQGCTDHGWADPKVGPSVDDLATALTELAPFRVTSPPEDVTAYGYSGKHLAWTVPDMPTEREGDETRFTGCEEGKLKSWVGAVDEAEYGDAFYGYSGPGYREEFWILDVDGTRLMIAAEQSAGSPSADVAEQQAILDSIRIEP